MPLLNHLRPQTGGWCNDDLDGIEYESVSFRVDAHGSDRWLVRATVRLKANGKARSASIALDTRSSPLTIVEVVASDDVHIERVPTADSGGDSLVVLTPGRKHDWSAVELHLALLWRNRVSSEYEMPRPPGREPCIQSLVLPDMLPALRTTSGLDGAYSRKLTRLSFENELPEELDAGGISAGTDDSGPSPKLLQTVMFRNSGTIGDDRVVVVPDFDAGVSNEDGEVVYEIATSMIQFLDQEFGFGCPVRSVVRIASSPRPISYAPTGAYCVLDRDWLPIGGTTTRKDVSIVRVLALAWLDGGIRIWGENSVEIVLALGGAFGLQWVKETRSPAEYVRVLQSFQVPRGTRDRGRNMGDAISEITLAIHHGIGKPEVRDVLRRMVVQHWGNHVPQDALVTALREADVSVPNVFM